MTDLHDRLRAARKTAGHYQYQIAAALDVSASAVTHYERGRRTPSVDLVAKWAELTFTDVGKLLDFDSMTPASPRSTLFRPVRRKAWAHLRADQRTILTFWERLDDRQRQNLLKLVEVMSGITSQSQVKPEPEKRVQQSKSLKARRT
jgi:transcriptional regulator with XRE-family HTH domain